MPELYEGQTEIVRTKLQEAELLMQANQETLAATTDPETRANLLRLIAGQGGTIGAYRRQLAKCKSDTDETRNDQIRVRLSATERAALEANAASAGQTLAQYVRARCGLDG